jgi:16S rRNA (cytosine1402-N4)-methyltransferase
VIHGEQRDLGGLLREWGTPLVDGLIADLGVSSPQLDVAERGFSFNKPGPLDMRMDTSQGETAAELLSRLDEGALADVLFQYGDERHSRKIARSILRALEAGELHTTEDLRRAVVRVEGPRKQGKIDPATRTFQALRIAVNGELDQLRALLDAVPDLLADGGVVAVISFHSHEDRMVKHTFRNDARLDVLTKRPILAGDEEQAANPRSRSAKLRVARRVPREAANEVRA